MPTSTFGPLNFPKYNEGDSCNNVKNNEEYLNRLCAIENCDGTEFLED